MNAVKTAMLLAGLTALMVLVGDALGGRGGMYIAFIMAMGMNLVSYWFSDKIVLKMYGAKEVSEAENPRLYRIVSTLSIKSQMPMPKVYMISDPSPNAFATGRNPNHAAVAATTGIMNLLTDDELEGVMAHELAHVKNRDILVGTVAAAIAGAIGMIAQMAQFAAIFGGRNDERGGSPIAAIAMMILAPIAAMIIQMAISRSREYGADEGGAVICGNPLALASALRKLQRGAQEIPLEDANQATAHMFIVSPLTGGGLLTLFSTHPAAEERIRRLEAMSGNL